MHKIGITGGMGSGKSTVCAIFASMGVPVYNADYEAKQLYTTDLTLKQTIKVPMGMMAEDLARPVIEVTDARTGIVTHEVYSYGEQVVVMPTDQLTRPENNSLILQYAAA